VCHTTHKEVSRSGVILDMHFHPRYLIAALALVGSLAAVPASASAAKHRTTRFVSATVDASIGSDAGGGLLAQGDFRSPQLGDGTIAYHTFVANTKLTTPFIDVEVPGGTLLASGTGMATRLADGSLDIRGTGTFHGGTGRYAHARGRFVYEGTSTAVSVVLGISGITTY
jgi:hypothetical protein